MQPGDNFLPWYNWQLIKFLRGYLRPEMDVFEYGIGRSTLFYAQRTKLVHSTETRTEWIEFVQDNARTLGLSNIKILPCDDVRKFPEGIAHFGQQYDIIIIDSYERMKCLTQSFACLKPNGILILDNSERGNLKDAPSIAGQHGLNILHKFCDIGPHRSGISEAIVFLNPPPTL